MEDKLFRTSVFGGYKKEDVLTYISKLETELLQTQNLLHMRDESSKKQSDIDITESKNMDIFVLDEEGEESGEQEGGSTNPQPQKAESPDRQEGVTFAQEQNMEIFAEQQKLLTQAKSEMEQMKNDLIQVRGELQASNRLYEQSEMKLQLVIAEKNGFENELEKLREQQKNYEKDYNAVKDVLFNARLDAEIILTKAKKEAQLLLENTQKQICEQKKESVEGLMRHLGENYSGLRTSKFYLEEQVKSIERTERQIEEIQSKMVDFLESTQEADPVNGEKTEEWKDWKEFGSWDERL